MKNKIHVGCLLYLHRVMVIVSILALFASTGYSQTAGTIYRIVSTSSGKAMTVNGNYDADAPVLMGAQSSDDKDQMWALINDGTEDGYGLMNIASRKSIDMALSASNAGKLLQWKPNLNNSNQVFRIQSPGIAGSAMQLLCAANPSLAVTEVSDGSLRMLSDLTDTNTYFEFREVVSAEDNTIPLPYFTYLIQPLNGNGVLSNGGSNDNDALIKVEQPDEKAYGQMWKLSIPAYQGGATTWYQLYNVKCGKCIDCALDNKCVPLQWTQDMNTSRPNWNQMFEVSDVEGVENAYRLKIGKNIGSVYSPSFEYYYLAVNSGNKVYMTQDETSTDTYFRFNRVAEENLPQGMYWQDEKVFEENKEPGHATYIPYQSTEAMRSDECYAKPWLDPVSSTRWLSLDGTWKLLWNVLDDEYAMPEEDFHGDDVDPSSWNNITVPGCLEMQGYGTPYYINVNYGFADNPPYIVMRSGMDNSVASYRRNFTLPDGWENERVMLHFDGIYSCAYVWVNGAYVGYSEGANMDAEFDVSKYVRAGDNNVSVRVIRWTDASYLEGQDMWHMSGIHRDVYLVSVPRIFVRDHHIHSDLSADATSGSLSVELNLDNRDCLEADKSYEVRLLSPDGKIMDIREAAAKFLSTETEKELKLVFEGLTDLKPWTADSPTLYTVEVIQKDADGNEESAISTKYGFCNVTIANSKFLVNGKRTLLRGVNTQDTHPLTGRTMDVGTMWQDLVMMKQSNVNAVRTSHYPRSPKMNAMMDYLGLYMMDEADVEFHKNWSDGGRIHTSSTWRAPIVDRVTRMVLRDRNHPSVVAWSLGNESDGGINHQYSYDAVRRLDSRPIHYEGATRAGTSPSDIHSVMYTAVPQVQNDVDRKGKPYFMCEYAHAMGHSVGNLKEYWDVMENSANGMGGCIWDWVDQAIVDYNDIKAGQLTVNGFNKYRNGNDYGGPHQGNFVNNGIITANRGVTGKLAEVKRIYQQVRFSDLNKDARTVGVLNNYESINLEGMPLRWELLLDGNSVQSGSVILPSIPSGESVDVEIPYNMDSDGEYLLNVSVALPASTAWAEKGHIIAATQYLLTERPAMSEIDTSLDTRLNLSHEGSDYVIEGGDIRMTVNTTYGITQWIQGGIDIIPQDTKGATAPAYSNYRWIENDAPYGNDPSYTTSNGVTRRSFSVSFEDDASGNVRIVENATGSLCNYVFVYTVRPNGSVDLDASYTVKGSNLRRIGMLMQFNPEFSMTRYYARGPLDNTVDRKHGADIGVYSLPVSDFHVDYVRPQTSGDRQDLRWIILHNAKGHGIKVETEGQVNLSLDNYTDEYKHNYLHQWDMPASDAIYANFDYAQLGIGNASCGAGVLSQYVLPTSGTYSYRLRFTTVKDLETGIADIPSLDGVHDTSANVPVYNLRGQLVGNTACPAALPRGIYIAGGKKFIVQ
ncbi:MAG: DUF4981 domain-containing protein [Paraprevotella sp.]|nr:DUF4981 domain-containing protein [Paraprevotella sp.]